MGLFLSWPYLLSSEGQNVHCLIYYDSRMRLFEIGFICYHQQIAEWGLFLKVSYLLSSEDSRIVTVFKLVLFAIISRQQLCQGFSLFAILNGSTERLGRDINAMESAMDFSLLQFRNKSFLTLGGSYISWTTSPPASKIIKI